MDEYFVYRNGEIVGRVAKFSDGVPYGWQDGKWEYMPSLVKIKNEDTDYEKISEAEAKELTGE